MDIVLSDEQIRSLLTGTLRHWVLEDGGIKRHYRTQGWKGTTMAIGAIAHLSELAWHHPDISASYAWVDVRLVTHSAKGVTHKDIALACKIEETIHWNPRADNGPLTGIPENDPRFAYIRYDD
jgi:4a-hydroxytetrahydrobiopterin dehydratase